jgi:4-alpha-glucanotransferase
VTCSLRLVLALHNHQPVGNFDGVFADACRDSYVPFLDLLDEFPEIPISLHLSGSLLEWLILHRPEYVDRVRSFVERGQIEILGGAFYEPILAGIPRRDRIGQIQTFSKHLTNTFGADIRGMWIPERVWEQSFASDIVKAGIEYSLLDDHHFRAAGLNDDQLHGYYLTEDEGRLLKIFPGSERLRYTIPFADPHETIDFLRGIAERAPGSVVTFGDDGEKFGTWPGTKKHVYEEGWLRRFLQTLRDNSEWLKVCTLAEAVDQTPPSGLCYLPDCSYREMTEWALPAKSQMKFHDLVEQKKHDPDWHELSRFLRGGFWRNFRVKYPEANEMYSRMMEVSQRLEQLASSPAGRENADKITQARTELYRAQCNCSYWHGAFGGLYLPHLRNAVFHHLIAADTLLETVTGRTGQWVDVQADDYNLDARKEIRFSGERLIGYLAPARGGHLYELDVRQTRMNLLATLDRRPEPYHDTVRKAGERQHEHHDGEVASIHDLVSFKQPDLDKRIVYDSWRRKSLVDHFLQPGLEFESFRQGGGDIGDFTAGIFDTELRRSDDRVEVRMSRQGQVGPYQVRLTKTVTLDAKHPGCLQIDYELEDLPAHFPIHFAVEFNFAGVAAGQDDRYYYDNTGQKLGQLQSVHSLSEFERVGLIDEWLGIDVSLETSVPAEMWIFPIETISQSEGGFEAVHQSCAMVPHWEFIVPEDGRWKTTFRLAIDTSAAQARKLREEATIG